MRYYIITYGCQMNRSDSQRLSTKLQKKGYQPAQKLAVADLVIINVCSVRQSAVDRVYSKVSDLNNLKKRPKIILTGCILNSDRKKLKDKVDEIWPHADMNILPFFSGEKTAYLPIMTGCNNFCSYCAVPYTRGREVSRDPKKILAHVKRFIRQGAEEIILLGQNVNSYKYGRTDFAQLIKKIDNLAGNFQFGFLTSHPKDLNEKLIDTLATCNKYNRQLHLPLQSGDNVILKKMKRYYTAAHYYKLINQLRKKIPRITISTDIIVGFPTETKKQFENTYKLCKKINFSKAYIARYSPRSQTQAAKLKDDVTSQEKKHRWLKLELLINKK